MANTFFLSDLHLDHKNICNFRKQFSSVEEHNALIKENYHKVIRKDDTVWFLGDVAFSKEALEDLKTWPGIKHIVLGNHDPSSEPKRTGASLEDMLEVFTTIHGIIKKYGFWISHCPIHPDELRGANSLHGHTHSYLINDARYMNLCMEHIDYTPISLEQIRNNFKEREKQIIQTETLNKSLKDILGLASSIIEEDNNRNYGDRDVNIHKLKNEWNHFIETHPSEEDPYSLILKNSIKVL